MPAPQASATGAPAWHGWLVAALPAVLLLPFIGTAFRIDDPMYIWAARHIQAHPADPYGFNVNWTGTALPMPVVMKNPPLISYYIALAAGAVGWSEQGLHLAFLLLTFLAGLGAYRLASLLCASPALAALAALCTPAFFVASLTLMCDVAMLALWVWAVYYWLRGLQHDRSGLLALAALLMSAAALTKYYAIALLPLLFAYTLVRTRRLGSWAVHFLIPVAILAWYQLATERLYGIGLLLNAFEFASVNGPEYGKYSLLRAYSGLVFVGGCLASTLFFSPLLWRRRALLAGAAVAAGLCAVFAVSGTAGTIPFVQQQPLTHLLLSAQLAVWGVVGASIFILTLEDLRAARDADSLLLALWVLGTFAFASFLNWSTNGRAVLPMVIPAGILLARRMERRGGAGSLRQAVAPLALSALLALLVVNADSAFAETGRAAARHVAEQYPPAGRTIWYRGHWGFQYYMDLIGATSEDFLREASFGSADMVITPRLNSKVGTPELPAWAAVRETLEVPVSPWVSTMGDGAGFHSDQFGLLPFAFGPTSAERFTVVGVRPELLGN